MKYSDSFACFTEQDNHKLPRGNPLSKEIFGRVLDMVIRERRHGVVTMIVIRLVADIDALDASLLGSLLKVFREKLALLVEVIAGTLRIRSVSLESQTRRKICKETDHVNENIQPPLPLLHQLGGIVLRPFRFLVFAEVAGERLLAPGAVDGVRDGRKGRDGFVFAGVTEELSARHLSAFLLSNSLSSQVALNRSRTSVRAP
jgi:hypothetical protein